MKWVNDEQNSTIRDFISFNFSNRDNNDCAVWCRNGLHLNSAEDAKALNTESIELDLLRFESWARSGGHLTQNDFFPGFLVTLNYDDEHIVGFGCVDGLYNPFLGRRRGGNEWEECQKEENKPQTYPDTAGFES